MSTEMMQREAPFAIPPGTASQSSRGPSAVNLGMGERWLDIAAGGTLALASGAFALTRRVVPAAALALAGGALVYRGVTRRSRLYGMLALVRADATPDAGLIVERSITIGRPRDEVYRFWRDLGNLKRVLAGLEAASPQGRGTSRWVVRTPFGREAEWEAQIGAEEPGRLIAWSSIPGSGLANRGVVRFADAPGNRGTEVRVRIEYQPPLGTAGAALAKLFGEEPNQDLRAALGNMKALLETGEIPTTYGQPQGSRSALVTAIEKVRRPLL